MCYLGETLRAIGVPSTTSGHRIPWRWSFDLHDVRSWLLLLRVYRCGIVLHGMVWLSHHLVWELGTRSIWLLLLLLVECVSFARLVLEMWIRCGIWLLGVTHPLVVLVLRLVDLLLRAWDVPVACATHGSLVDHQLNVLSLGIKSSIHERLCWVVVRAVIVLWDKLSDILGGWRTGQERLWQVLGDLPTMVDELVLHDLIKIWSAWGITAQDSLNQITSGIRNADVLRKTIADLLDPPVRGLHISCLEGRFSNDESVNNYSKRPDIDLIGVSTLSLQNLWRNIVWSSTDSSFFLSIEIEFRCKSKISQLYLHLVI